VRRPDVIGHAVDRQVSTAEGQLAEFCIGKIGEIPEDEGTLELICRLLW
jgi:hypothetical protein